MSRQIERLSVFLPAYNEEANIKKTVKNVVENLQKNVSEWEIVIVDDGSKDKTGAIADQLAKENKKISVIHHSPNRGYGAAFKSGLYGCKYPWISFIDSDGQFDFKEISRFIETQEKTGADMVIGYYLKRKVPFTRILNSKIWQLIVFILFGLNVRDIDCGFKLISKKIVDTIPKLESERGAFISSEFLIKAKKAGFKITQIGVQHYPRKFGEATGAKLNVIVQSFIDLFKLWQKIK
ncbi:TPA: glycosyltransferase family 2 protein [Candidatus Collierbacteria bacterium]|nr:glycosyltransferase family 2 protein [Candidatus Collierbacteria bacterium]HAS69157.1 glycosyltransferase family 2 protein [Candidatus Collierbacteria bacterium]